MKHLVLTIPLSLIFAVSFSQESMAPPHPEFSPLSGTVYHMPIIEVQKGKHKRKGLQENFGEFVFDYDSIAYITLNEVKIPETVIGEGKFPGVEKNTRFAMLLEGEVRIQVDACYEFSLSSDDGSILWIDQMKVVDNDGGHQMELKKDTVGLDKGKYPVRLWYFQGLADRFGLLLDAKIIGKSDLCTKLKKEDKITLQSTFLFDRNDSNLKKDAYQSLNAIVEKLKGKEIKTIKVMGHTDSVGSKEYNQELSEKRVKSVVSFLKSNLDMGINYLAEGKGENFLISKEATEEAHKLNRRVELFIEYK